MISTDGNDVGPFVIEGRGCHNWTTGDVMLFSRQSYTITVSTCPGDHISVTSDSWLKPAQVDTCFEYIVD